MKNALRKLFSPVLNIFENGEDIYVYKPSHRTILLIVGSMFLLLASGGIAVAIIAGLAGGAIPAVVFLLVGLVCWIVGFLGNDKAVANIWKNR